MLISVVIGIVGGLVFFIIDKEIFQGNTNFTDNSHLTLVYMLVGSALGILAMFTDISLFNILACFLYAAGLGQHLYLTMFPWADLFKGVPFFVSDKISGQMVYNTFLAFVIIYALVCLISIVSCFVFKKEEVKTEKLDKLNNPL